MKGSPEKEWILRVLRSFLKTSSSSVENDLVWDRLQWDTVLSVIRYQGLLPIFYHVLSRQGLLEKTPYRQQFQEEYLESAAHTLFYEDFLRDLIVSLQQKEIPFLLIKGPFLAHEFYRPPEVRPYNDIDLLIQERHYELAKSVLFMLGMEMTEPERESVRRTYFNSVTFSKSGTQKAYVDLHWETLMISWNRQPFLRSEEVWKGVRWVTIAGLKLPGLQPQMLLPYLCLHLALHHQFGNLLTLCDLALVIARFGEEMDWQEMVRKSNELRIRKPVYYSLKLTASLLGTEIPADVLLELRSPKIEEKLIPFDFLVFRKRPLSVNVERFIKWVLIDDLEGKKNSLAAFFSQKKEKRRGFQANV